MKLSGEQAMANWRLAADAVNQGRYDDALRLPLLPSDRKLIEQRIDKQRAATLCGSSGPHGKEPAAHQSTEQK